MESTLKSPGRCLQHVNFDLPNEKFTFIVNDARIVVSSIQAEFLSPKIARIRRSDASFDTYTIRRDPGNHFSEFVKLSTGQAITVTDANYEFFWHLASDLENKEIFTALDKMRAQKDEYDDDNAVSILLTRLSLDVPTDEVAGYIAKRFCEIPEEELKRLGLFGLERVFKSDKFSSSKLASKKRFQIVQDLLENGGFEYLPLLTYINFSNLDEDALDWFKVVILNAGQENVPKELWERIVHSIRGSMAPAYGRRQEFLYDNHSVNMFNGIIKFLSEEECGGGNVDQYQVVGISSPGGDGEHPARNVADLSDNNFFLSGSAPKQWICYDFKERAVQLKGYSLRSLKQGIVGGNNLRSWVLEVRDKDSKVWKTVDKRENNGDLNGPDERQYYEISDCPVCRYVRLTQTDTNHRREHVMSLAAFEVFGVLYSND